MKQTDRVDLTTHYILWFATDGNKQADTQLQCIEAGLHLADVPLLSCGDPIHIWVAGVFADYESANKAYIATRDLYSVQERLAVIKAMGC